MFSRAQSMLGSNWTIHDLRHTAAFRMTSDPDMPLSDVQWILGHAHLTTTQLYLTQLSGIASDGREYPGREGHNNIRRGSTFEMLTV